MGYFTYYDLEVQPDKNVAATAKDIIAKMREMGEDAFYPFECAMDELEDSEDTVFSMACDDNAKWYDFNEEMTALSEQFPDTRFKLHGDGEEPGDSWDKYYVNGKSAEYRPVMPEYDPKDLK